MRQHLRGCHTCLVEQSVPVWTYDLPGSQHRLRLIMNDTQLAQVTHIAGDITDQAGFERAVARRAFNRTLRQNVWVEPELASLYT